MIVNVDAVLVFSGVVFVATMGGLGALWLSVRRGDREYRRKMERWYADRG